MRVSRPCKHVVLTGTFVAAWGLHASSSRSDLAGKAWCPLPPVPEPPLCCPLPAVYARGGAFTELLAPGGLPLEHTPQFVLLTVRRWRPC